MTRLILATLLAGGLLVEPATAHQTRHGYAAHYRPHLMERVSRVRGLPVVPCMVASPYHRIGTWLTVTSARRGKTLTCRVTDVPHPRDRASIIRRRIVVELDFRSARILCGIEYVGQEPPWACPVGVRLKPRGVRR